MKKNYYPRFHHCYYVAIHRYSTIVARTFPATSRHHRTVLLLLQVFSILNSIPNINYILSIYLECLFHFSVEYAFSGARSYLFGFAISVIQLDNFRSFFVVMPLNLDLVTSTLKKPSFLFYFCLSLLLAYPCGVHSSALRWLSDSLYFLLSRLFTFVREVGFCGVFRCCCCSKDGLELCVEES